MQQMEAVSPELVLVDPDLALRERARLASTPPVWALTAVSATRQITVPDSVIAAEKRRRWTSSRLQEGLMAGMLGLSLLVNGYLLADRLGASTEAAAVAPTVAVAPPNVAPHAPTAHPDTSIAEATVGAEVIAPRSAPVTSRIEAERRVLAQVVEAPVGKLPTTLIDRSSGLPKNNLQAVCTRTAATSFFCVVRPAGQLDGEGVYVRYSPARSAEEAFTWSPYRSEKATRSQG